MVSSTNAEDNVGHSLGELQSFVWQAISRPLADDFVMQKRWIDGSDLSVKSEEFVQSNSRLTSFERLEIYNQQYWYRLLDCLEDDFPGLSAVLGQERFEQLSIEYLKSYPSMSFTLRDIGRELPGFILSHPALVEPHFDLSCQMVRFEWAQIVAFDSPALEPIAQDYILKVPPHQLRVCLQPYITLLALEFALDEYSNALKRHQREHGEAASERRCCSTGAAEMAPWPVPEKLFLVVHRHDNMVYFKRLEPAAFELLSALSEGHPLTDALSSAVSYLENAGQSSDDLTESVQNWFKLWIRLNWLCKLDSAS